MKLYPEAAENQLEFDKVKALLLEHCRTEFAVEKAQHLRIHTRKDYIIKELSQTYEYKLITEQNLLFPNDVVLNIQKDLKLLGITGSTIVGEQWMQVKRLCMAIENIFRWFNQERRLAFTSLALVIADTYYEKAIVEMIDEVLDESGNVKDTASEDLQRIRMNLYKKRNELRRAFERVVAKLSKAGYTTDIAESFSNGRRVVAVFSEHKRQIKGILHGESDSRKTTFIEPEETIELNNDVYSLENDERKEVLRILRALTSKLSVYAPLLKSYHDILGIFDFIRAKAKLALDMNGNFPSVSDKVYVDLKDAYHPLLYLYNKKLSKPTIPLNISFDEKDRILVISGPNAGGKTVAMKTIGLNQMMMQSGLLVPVKPDSQMGIFKQLFIHIGDTQSIEFELSTYSAQLNAMKYFIENANGKTLFFIDELGGGSDPNLGGAFAEVILEELSRKHSVGIVTTHYLNLKVMANRTPGLFNGAMAFDEVRLQPLYKLIVGKPGSSYTFSIAERIGLPKPLINRAKKLVDEDHFRLDKLLNSTEQDMQQIDKEKKQLHKLIRENEKLKKEMETVLHKEKHKQQVEILKQQNKITEDRIAYLKDTERKLRQMVVEWRKADDKNTVVKNISAVLFPKNEKIITGKMAKKIDARYKETAAEIIVGTKVKIKKNHQVGEVKELRGKRAIVQIGQLPINVELNDLVAVQEKNQEN
ncbi:MutS2/Smr-associated SH3 domain-containing protein [Haoranjiania flava]|uniref:DNA mismatch repair protein MutS n=1 Tax=Haoranjiania flava TaxID=1856322 RepID=A0AAE3IL10_9BACT|nr:MutS2/Smr-associated SH3 domain-containing protein [Haoranjiania flava]MCU7694105.1 DNA mismatch repair protein MutS [Haoranjiania flava]